MKCGGTRASLRLALAVSMMAGVVMGVRLAEADAPHGTETPLTRFERFLVGGCTPCVKESVPIATVAVPALRLAALERMVAGRVSRSGEISVEVLRAYQLGRASRQMLALRVTLSISTGNPGELYRLASGIVDEDEISAMAVALREIGQAASSSATPARGAETTEMDVHSGSLRLGTIRLQGDAVAFVQAGDVHLFARRPVWEVPGTLYVPVTQLSALAKAIGEAETRVQSVRRNQ